MRLGVDAVLDGRVPGRYWMAEHEGRVVGQLLITYEWSDWRNRQVWWIQSVHVAREARRLGVFRALYAHVRGEAQAAGAGGLRLYVDDTNTRAQAVYAALGMNGGHYRVFEDMFDEPAEAGVNCRVRRFCTCSESGAWHRGARPRRSAHDSVSRRAARTTS